jgi:hypothetical protein
MLINSSEFKTITGDLEDVANASPLAPFSDEAISFFNDLSGKLMLEKAYPDVVTYGFWIRQASLIKEKAKYDDINARLGRGIAFHIAPSNVAVNFAYSLAAGLLAGNANIVRLPSKDFPQVDVIASAINELLKSSHKKISPYVCLVKYPINKDISDKLSSICDIRVVWGGDRTIAELRNSPLKPRAAEITFADRYSAAVINADAYLQEENKLKVAQNFYNDTYLSDQNACTSPSVVFWTGDKKSEAKGFFWNNIRKLAQEKYQLAAVQAVGKLSAFYRAAANINVCSAETIDNYVTRVEISSIPENLMDFKYNSGFFFECDINNLREILPICCDKFQTLAYYGLGREEIENFINCCRPRGIDRVVPIGKSMDFALVWDGHDLIREMSRRVMVESKPA